jgi:hypothetical protein
MGLGYKQKELVRIGQSRGFVTIGDVAELYAVTDVNRVMNTLVLQGHFKKEIQSKTGILIYRYTGNV